MSAPTTTAPRIVRFTATLGRDCASPWTCTGVQVGTRAGYVGAYGPRPVCQACAERIEAGESPDLDTAPCVEELCECATRTGFTGRPDGVFVCAGCGRPAAFPDTTAATHRTVDVVTPAEPDAPAVPEVGDVARITKIELLEDGPAETPPPADEPAAPLTLVHRGRGDWTVAHQPTGTHVLTSLRNKRDAQAALDRLAALPIRWDSVVTETRPAVGEGNLALPERTVTVMGDPASKRLIRTEQERILGVEPPSAEQAPDEPATTEDARGEVTATAVLSGGPREEGAPAPDTTATGPDAGTAAPETPEPPRNEPASSAEPRQVLIGPDAPTTECAGCDSDTCGPCDVRALVAEQQAELAPPAAQPDDGWHPVTPQQRGAAEVEAWVAGQPEPTTQETVEQLTQRVAAVDTLADAQLITPYAAAHAVPPTDRAQVPAPETDEPMPLPDLTSWMPEARQWGADPAATTRDAITAIRDGILAGDIRGRQVEIGPSEVGHECARWLAYRLAGVPPTGTEPLPWRQRIGTLVHADIDDHLARDNQHREDTGRRARWLTGIRVDVGELYPGRTITGTLDILDVLTATVLDAKVPGSTAMKTYGKGKPERESYRVQVQLYGRGVMRSGFLPAHVGVLRVSPARELSEYIVKTEPFDAGIAERALARAGGIARMVDQLGDRAVALLPPTEATCHRCPWLRPDSTDLARGCPGAPGADLSRSPSARASVDDLVA